MNLIFCSEVREFGSTEIGRTLTEEELDIAKDGLEWGLMFDIETVYNTILFEMIKDKSP